MKSSGKVQKATRKNVKKRQEEELFSHDMYFFAD